MTAERPITLSNGTRGIVRPIVPADADALANALWELAPDSRMRRFLFDKTDLTGKELARFSNPDGTDHIAYGLAVEIEGEAEPKPIAVARCFRDPEDAELAEIAMVTADAWQGLGAGSELLRSLSAAAYAVGIRRWSASMFADNLPMRRLLDRFSTLQEERELGSGIVETVHLLKAPEEEPREHIKYHRDGSVRAKGWKTAGVLTGYWEWFRLDGTRMRSGSFENGEQTGEWTTYDKEGKVHKVTRMKPVGD